MVFAQYPKLQSPNKRSFSHSEYIRQFGGYTPCLVDSSVLIAKSAVFPQQRKLMGSSAQNSSGVHWCRRRVRFNEVPEKVWEVLVQSRLTFNRVPEKVPEKVWEALMQSLNRVPEKVPEKVPGRLGSGEGPREGSGEGRGGFGAEPSSGEDLGGFAAELGGFGAKPGQVQQGSEEGSGEGLGGLVQPGQSNRVPEKVPEKVPGRLGSGEGPREGSGEGRGGFGAEPSSGEDLGGFAAELGGFGAKPGQVQQGSEEGSGEGLGGLVQPGQSNRVPEKKVPEKKVPEKVREALSGSTGFQVWEALVQSQVRFNRVPEKVPEKV